MENSTHASIWASASKQKLQPPMIYALENITSALKRQHVEALHFYVRSLYARPPN